MLTAADLLERHYEVLARQRAVDDVAMLVRETVGDNTTAGDRGEGKAPINIHSLLCTLQNYFITLTGADLRAGPGAKGPQRATFGFKEIVVPPGRLSVVDHEDGFTPPARHLPVSSAGQLAPRWLRALDSIFPCARIVYNTRKDVDAQAMSGFHRKQGSSPEELKHLNNAIHELHAKRGNERSLLIAAEDLSTQSLTELAHWMVRFARDSNPCLTTQTEPSDRVKR